MRSNTKAEAVASLRVGEKWKCRLRDATWCRQFLVRWKQEVVPQVIPSRPTHSACPFLFSSVDQHPKKMVCAGRISKTLTQGHSLLIVQKME